MTQVARLLRNQRFWIYFVSTLLLFIGLLGVIEGPIRYFWPLKRLELTHRRLGAEFVGIGVTVLVIDTLNRSAAREREEQLREIERAAQEEYEKARLILQMGSPFHESAVEAVRQLKWHGWLADGSLREASLAGANLQGMDLYESELAGVDLGGAKLRRCSLNKACLKEAYLWGADLREAKVEEADLRGAILFGADLREATLRRTDLRGADLANSKLHGVNLWLANLVGAKMSHTKEHLEMAIDARQLPGLEGMALPPLPDGEVFPAIFDEETVLPDGERWNKDVDMGRYTDPDHQEFVPPSELGSDLVTDLSTGQQYSKPIWEES